MKLPSFLSRFHRGNRDAGWVAVSLANDGIYVAQARYVGVRPQVTRCSYFPQTEITSSTLDKLRKDAGLDEGRLTTLLAPNEYQIMMVEAPNVPLDELKTAVRWKIKDSLSYHIDDATVDVLQIPAGKYGNDRPQSLYAVAASNETVKKRIALFEKARLELSVIDIPEMAQRNIAALYETEGRALGLLAFTGEGGLLTLTCDGELYLARRIEISIGQLTDADETLRQQYRDRVELEVQRSLDYFDRQFHHLSVERLLVSAPEAAGLAPVLADNLGVSVEPLDLRQGMDLIGVPELDDSEFACHALHALGAALRQEKKVL